MIPATPSPADISALQLAREFRVFAIVGIDAAGHCACPQGAACDKPGKHPFRGSRGSTDATQDPAAVIRMFRDRPEANFAIATGQGLVALDVDVDPAKGLDGFATLEALGITLPPTRTARTGRGGKHFFFRCAEDVTNSAGQLGAGLDVRGRGGYLVAPPSLHKSGQRYEWIDDSPIAEIPGALLALTGTARMRVVRPHATVVVSGPRRALALDRAARLLRSRGVEAVDGLLRAEAEAWASPAMTEAELLAACSRAERVPVAPGRLAAVVHEGSRDNAMLSFLGAWRRRGFGEAALVMLGSVENARRFVPPLPASDVERIARSCMRWGAGDPYFDGLEDADAEADEFGWQDRLARKPAKDDEPAKLVSSEANAITLLRSHPEWRAVLAWDARADVIRFEGEPPYGVDERTIDRAGSAWEDDDASRCAAWLDRAEGVRVAPRVAEAAARVAAKTRAVDPVRAYLEALEWDRVPRLSSWLETYARAGGPEIIRRGVGRMWLISAVARTYEPGCQADYMLVLEGAQGAGKSSLLRALSPIREVFSETPLDLGSKDALQGLRGRWIIEMAELKSIRGAHSIDAVKSFLTACRDDYRASYGRVVTSHDRRCVFAGSVNPEVGSDYLNDPTGARRFWPVPVGVTDRSALERDRDQLWAEAVAAYRDREPWHPARDGELEAALLDAQSLRTTYDENTTTIGQWLGSTAGRAALAAAQPSPAGYLSVTEVATSALAVSRDRVDGKAQSTVRKALGLLGWRQIPVRYQGARPRLWAPPSD